jgi:hypothetical protein
MKNNSKAVWVACMSLFISTAAYAQTEKDLPPAWPRPGSTLLVENDRGAAYNVVYEINKPSPMHRHRYFFAGLDLNTASVKFTNLDGTYTIGPVVRDHMWWLPKGLTHQEMSVTDPGRNTVVIDIKEKRVPAAANTTKLPTDKYATYQNKIVDNDMVTIWDCAWSPGAPGVSGFDSRDMFLAFADGGDLSIAEDGQPAKTQHYDRGQAIFLSGGKSRTISSSNGTVRAMLVEVK